MYQSTGQLQASKVAIRSIVCTAGSMLASQANIYCQAEEKSRDQNVDAAKYPEFAKFVKKYRCSAEIEQQVGEALYKIKFYDGVSEYLLIPFYNKGARIDRIINAHRMKKVIEINKLDHLAVPDKCLCHMYADEWNVIAKKVKRNKGEFKISLEQAQQLATLAQETGYGDFHLGNILHDDQHKIVIIDTEDRSYRYSGYELACLEEFIARGYLRKEDLQWLHDKIESGKTIPNILWRILFGPTPLSGNSQYDDADIDLKKVKQEFAQLQNENRKKLYE